MNRRILPILACACFVAGSFRAAFGQDPEDPLACLEKRITSIYDEVHPSVVGIRVEIPRKTWLSAVGRGGRLIYEISEKLAGESSAGGAANPRSLSGGMPGEALIPIEGVASTPVERHGSGLVFDEEGHILTTYQVVRDVTGEVKIVVISDREGEVPASIYAVDPYTNIAVIRTARPVGKPAEWSDSKTPPRPGTFVFSVSRPYGLPNSAYFGLVCGLNRRLGQVRYERLIQTTVPLHPGSNGAPLVGSDGKVVGILSATLKHEGWSEVSFAIPSDLALEIGRSLVEHGSIVRGFLGVRVANADQLEKMGAPGYEKVFGRKGAVVTMVVPDSPATDSGIRSNDLITRIGDDPIGGWEDLVWVMHRLRPGMEVPVRVLRGDEALDKTVRVGHLPQDAD